MVVIFPHSRLQTIKRCAWVAALVVEQREEHVDSFRIAPGAHDLAIAQVAFSAHQQVLFARITTNCLSSPICIVEYCGLPRDTKAEEMEPQTRRALDGSSGTIYMHF